MRKYTKIAFLWVGIFGLRLAALAVIGTSDDFDTNSNTFPDWVNVGSVSATILYHSYSGATDYDDGNPAAYLTYVAGMTLTGDGVKGDGGLRLDTFNATAGDEAIGLTIAGMMTEGEIITFSGSVYNNNPSACTYKAQLWNLTDDVLLKTSAGILVEGYTQSPYVPVDFLVFYEATANDDGDTLQIRIGEEADNVVRDVYVDNFTLSTTAAESLPEIPDGATYPWGDKFWFSFYSTVGTDSAYAVDHGATGIGPYYGGIAGQVAPLAEAYTLGAYFSYKVELPSMAGFSPSNTEFVWPSDETLIAEATAVVDAVQTNLNIVMWDLVPEELRYWKAPELNFLNVVSEAIRQADLHNRPVMMYEPKHRNAAALSQTIPYQDICGKGIYVNLVDNGDFRHNRIWARWAMEQEVEAIAAANTNAVPWITLEMSADVQSGEEHWIEDWCRHDAYMGLIMGGKGISIWSGWRPRSSWVNDFQTFFDGYLSVAEDLNQERNLAPVFLYGTDTTGVTHVVTSGPSTLELDYDGEVNYYPPVTYTMREFLGSHYLFMVNSATQSVTLTFNGVPDAARTELFTGSAYPASGGSFSITLDSYEVAGFRFDGYEAWRDANFTAQQILDGDADEGADADSDGRTNRDEFNADTDPNDDSEYFQTDLSYSNLWKTVSFNTASNRFYHVERSTNLVSGTWVPMLGNEPGTGGGVSVVDTNGFPSSFYRTRVDRP